MLAPFSAVVFFVAAAATFGATDTDLVALELVDCFVGATALGMGVFASGFAAGLEVVFGVVIVGSFTGGMSSICFVKILVSPGVGEVVQSHSPAELSA